MQPIYLLGAALAAMVIGRKALDGDGADPPSVKAKMRVLKRLPGKDVPLLSTVKLSRGPLPAAALRAVGEGRYGPDNNIHKRGSWVYVEDYSSDFRKRKMDDLIFVSDPPSTVRIKQKDNSRNLAWLLCCPRGWYPTKKRWGKYICEVDELNAFIGRASAIKNLVNNTKDYVRNIPKTLKAAGIVLGAAASGGATLSVGASGQLSAVVDAVKANVKVAAAAGFSRKSRKKAAAQWVGGVIDLYEEMLVELNPHLRRHEDGRLDLGPNYRANPKTYADLRAQGDAYPLVKRP